MWLSETSGHGAGSQMSQWGSTINSPTSNKSVSILILPYILLGSKTINKQSITINMYQYQQSPWPRQPSLRFMDMPSVLTDESNPPYPLVNIHTEIQTGRELGGMLFDLAQTWWELCFVDSVGTDWLCLADYNSTPHLTPALTMVWVIRSARQLSEQRMLPSER